jgi:hypothetical protein
MTRLHPVALVPLAAGTLVASVLAQAPATSRPAAPTPTPARPAVTNAQPGRQAVPAPRPAAPKARRRSIVHHYPYPYPGYYHSDPGAGWRNPGGVGRYSEYYSSYGPYQMTQPERDPVRVATFGDGGIPDRDEQMRAVQIGAMRNNSIQQHIDNYARPYYGYGFGVGYFGGFY